MSRTCTYCDGHHPTETCTERLEAYHGVPADHSVGLDDDATVWVQDLDDETWHASMVRDDDVHMCACGARLQCPVGGVKPDSRMATVGIEKCEACQDYLAEDEETVPDGGDYRKASELRADGGTCTDDTEQTRLGGPGYCGLTGQYFPGLSPGDNCPLCTDPLGELPDTSDTGTDQGGDRA